MNEDITLKKAGKIRLPRLSEIDPEKVNNAVLSSALARIKQRRNSLHGDYYTRHSSHKMYSKGWV